MHLSPEFGLTYKEIEKAGFPITKKIEIILSSDTPVGISKSIGLGMISFAEALDELRPDLLVILGDRYEMLAVASAATICRVPIAHIHGGEATEGVIDEPIRHSITKMSHIHFTVADVYKRRVIQLGERPENVYNFGAPGIDNIIKLDLLDKQKLEAALDFKLGVKYMVVTFHPVTLEFSSAETQFNNLLAALDHFVDFYVIFTKPNADTEGRIISALIDTYVRQHEGRCTSFQSMGQLLYLSAIKSAAVVVGNSSSGIIEAPTLKVATVNIGDRQKGRVKAPSVIDCKTDKLSIIEAIRKATSESMKAVTNNQQNPYGNGGASTEIARIIKTHPLENILKKEFYNL
jgi:GDP/UDP-N,N'-diacetylbacillosamine 2-epimerase (hydrolysing)